MTNEKKYLLLLLGGLFMLALEPVTALSQDNIYYNSTLIVEFDDNLTLDNSSNQLLGTVQGTPVLSSEQKILGSGSAYFDKEQSSGITFNDPTLDEMINFSMWTWINATADLTGTGHIMTQENSGAQGSWAFGFEYNNDLLRFSMRTDNDVDIAASSTTTQFGQLLNNSNFVMVGAVINRTGTSYKAQLYINDTIVAESSGTMATTTRHTGNLNLAHKDDPTPSSFITSGVDSINIVNKSLTSDDFVTIFNSGAGKVNGPVTDVENPQINISLNNTALTQGLVVNVTGNWSDDIGGSFGSVIVNQTGVDEFFNFSLGGATSGSFTQNITVSVAVGVINYTVRLNDSLNQFNQSSELIVLDDSTAPEVLNISLQRQPIMNNTDTNLLRIFCKDSQSNINTINFTIRHNQTENFTRQLVFGSVFGVASNTTSQSNVTATYSLTVDAVPETSEATIEDRKSYIWNYSIYSDSEVAKEGRWNVTDVGCRDVPLNYAANDSSNKFVGFDFLIDTPPAINSNKPISGSTVEESINVIFNSTITEKHASHMLLYTNISGNWLLNQTKDYNGDGTTVNIFDELNFTLGHYGWAIYINTTFGTWTNSSNFTITFNDVAPIINSRSPLNGSNFTSASDTTGNLVITEDSSSFILLFHNITGKHHLNQTINYSGDGTTQNLFNLTGMVNRGHYVYSTSVNTSFGTWTNSSNTTFGVLVAEGGGNGGGGGGGGGVQTIVVEKNITAGQCNFDGVCDAILGEDSFNCNKQAGGDCEFKVEEILPTCLLDKNQQCIYRTGFFLKLLGIMVVLSLLILVSDTKQGLKIRKLFKERLNLDFKF